MSCRGCQGRSVSGKRSNICKKEDCYKASTCIPSNKNIYLVLKEGVCPLNKW